MVDRQPFERATVAETARTLDATLEWVAGLLKIQSRADERDLAEAHVLVSPLPAIFPHKSVILLRVARRRTSPVRTEIHQH